MPKIVHQRQRLRQIHINRERARDRASDLRDFDGMGEPVPKVVGIAASENLCLVFQPAKGARVDYPIAVALKIVTIGMRLFRKTAPAGMLHLHRIAGQHGNSLALLIVY